MHHAHASRWLRVSIFLSLSLAWAAEASAQLVGLPARPELTSEGRALLYEFEVGGGQDYYDRYLARPTWPGFASGVTVGVGYDCGYNSTEVIRQDWRRFAERERLAATAGITGSVAKGRIAALRDIVIRWELAEDVFEEVTVARFYALCGRTYPRFEALHPNAQAALLSLTFNRGDSMAGPRRAEMRAIRELTRAKDYAGIAAQLRAMKRIWRGTDIEAGMARRREAEARLMETAK
jgi:hypothetical protein